jgi:hypothetical protein
MKVIFCQLLGWSILASRCDPNSPICKSCENRHQKLSRPFNRSRKRTDPSVPASKQEEQVIPSRCRRGLGPPAEIPDISDPTLAEIDRYAARIFDATDLFQELEDVEVDYKLVAEIAARAKSWQNLWDSANRLKRRAKNNRKNLRRHLSGSRSEIQKKIVTIYLRETIASDSAYQLKRSSTKERPYLRNTIVPLWYLFTRKGTDPWRLMAAVFNLFNLLPAKPCLRCDQFDRVNEWCGREAIFKCDRHQKTRRLLWTLGNRHKEYILSFPARVQDSDR